MAEYQEYLRVIYITSIVFFFLLCIKSNCHCSITPSVTVGQGEVDAHPSVWLTVSSVVEEVTVNVKRYFQQRKLELNWKNVPMPGEAGGNEGVWVGLFDFPPGERPNSDDALVSLQINKSVAKRGRFRSGIEFPIYTFSSRNLTNQCLGYWIAMFNPRSVLAANCIRTHPFWMEESLPFILDKSLKELMIPGTHNAGAYEIGYQQHKDWIYKKYTICQDESIFGQLTYGIRYFDLRVAYERSTGSFRIVHNIFSTENTLRSVLEQVRQFLDATSAEIIILDFHRFEAGFTEHAKDRETHTRNKQLHQTLSLLVESILGDFIARDTRDAYNVKVSTLLAANKRVIIGYAANNYVKEMQYFPKVRHLWANAENVTELEKYLSRVICIEGSFEATSAMAQLTPGSWGAFFNKYGGLRKMAQDVNWIISRWFDERWAYCANIVSTDFFLGNNIIDIAIMANKKRAFVRPEPPQHLF